MHPGRGAADKKVTVGDQGAPSSDLECFSVGFWKRQIFDEFSIGKKVVPKSQKSAKLAPKASQTIKMGSPGGKRWGAGGGVISNINYQQLVAGS